MSENEDTEDKSKIPSFLSYVVHLRVFIGVFLIIVLMFLMFKAGALTACSGGYMQGFSCIQPRVVDLVQVCEYGTYSCAATCDYAMINDKDAFYNSSLARV